MLAAVRAPLLHPYYIPIPHSPSGRATGPERREELRRRQARGRAAVAREADNLGPSIALG